MLLYGAVFAAHAGFDGTAPDAFQSAVAVTVLAGGRLKAAVAVSSGSAVDAMIFIGIVLMKSVYALRAARTERRRTAKSTFSSHYYPLYGT